MRELQEYPAEGVDARLDAGKGLGNEAALQSAVINIDFLQGA